MPIHLSYHLRDIVLRFPPEDREELFKALHELALYPDMGTPLTIDGSPDVDVKECVVEGFLVMYEVTEDNDIDVVEAFRI